MEYNLSQTFEDSRKAVDDYLKYILCQSSEQREKADYSLNSLMDSVNAVGTVAAMAAKESMVSHNSTFQMLHAINEAQGALMDLVIDFRLNGGTGGGGISDGVSKASSLVTLVNSTNPLVKAAAVVTGLFGSKLDGSEEMKRAELNQYNSLTNKAIRAKENAGKLVGEINYSINPMPNPATNGPAPLMNGNLYSILPFIGSAADAAALIEPLKEGYQAAAEAKAAHTPMAILRRKAEEAAKMIEREIDNAGKELKGAYEARMQIPNPSTGADESTQIYNMQTHIATMQPQSVQVVAQPASTSVAPEQNINLNINNEFKGIPQSKSELNNIGEYLAQQICDKLNSGAMLLSNNW